MSANKDAQYNEQKQPLSLNTVSNEWCVGCVFEHRYMACPHDVENCKKITKELQKIEPSRILSENNCLLRSGIVGVKR